MDNKGFLKAYQLIDCYHLKKITFCSENQQHNTQYMEQIKVIWVWAQNYVTQTDSICEP